MDNIAGKINTLRSDFARANSKSSSAKFSGWHFVIDIISGLFIGFFIGYYTDEYLDTKPLFIFFCTILGTIAGAYNMHRNSRRLYDKNKI